MQRDPHPLLTETSVLGSHLLGAYYFISINSSFRKTEVYSRMQMLEFNLRISVYADAKTKAQISFAITAHLMRMFVLAA